MLTPTERRAAERAISGGATSGHWQYAALALIADSLLRLADAADSNHA